MEIGPRIKLLRENARLTQIELAKILKINNSTLSQYENGVRIPSDDVKISIANFFDVSLDYLLGRTDQQEKPILSVEDGLSERHQQLIQLFDAAPPELQSAALAVLRSAGEQGIEVAPVPAQRLKKCRSKDREPGCLACGL